MLLSKSNNHEEHKYITATSFSTQSQVGYDKQGKKVAPERLAKPFARRNSNLKGSPDEEWKWSDGEADEPMKNLDRAYIRAEGLGGFTSRHVQA